MAKPMLLVLAILLLACASPQREPEVVNVPLLTQAPRGPNQPCAAALAAGTLAAHPERGLALDLEWGGRTVVVWPFGYSAVRVDGGPVLLRDPSGRVVAREGDQVELGGGFTPRDEQFVSCAGPTVVRPAGG